MSFKIAENNKNGSKLDGIMQQRRLVQESPAPETLSARIKLCQEQRKPLKVLYGETFDGMGNPLDSLKYYLFVSALAKAIKHDFGIDVESTILVADLGVYRNYPEQVDEYKKYAASREAFARKVKQLYSCSYDVRLMSDLGSTPEFKQRFEKVREISNLNEELMGMIRRAFRETASKPRRREASSTRSRK